MTTELSDHSIVVGTKQTKRAIDGGTAKRVFLAPDADPRITDPIAALCGERGIPVERERSMKALGKACGISVGCAVAAEVE